MKNPLAEEKEGNLPAVKQSKIQDGGGGKRLFWVILYYFVLGLVVIAAIYFLTKINTNTYKINI